VRTAALRARPLSFCRACIGLLLRGVESTEWVRLCSGATSRGGSRWSSVRICRLRCLTLALVCCAVWAAPAGAARSHGSAGVAGSGAGSVPLVGVNYSHFGVLSCGDVNGDGIVANGMGNRTLIRRHLAAMRAAGIQSLRIFIWNQHDATGQAWGVVSSASPLARRATRVQTPTHATHVRRRLPRGARAVD
jgi:hypothetical protein